jgi:hypothetical protein
MKRAGRPRPKPGPARARRLRGAKAPIWRDANMAERVGDVDVEAHLGGPGLSQPVHEPFIYRLAALIHAGGPYLWAMGKSH